MPMNTAFLTVLAGAGAAAATHIGLFVGGVEVSGGGYARKPVTWSGSGAVRNPSANIAFNGPPSTAVNEWRAFSALTGGTDYGGASMTGTGFDASGNFTLLAASTNFALTAV